MTKKEKGKGEIKTAPKTKNAWTSRKLITLYVLFVVSTLFFLIIPNVTFTEWGEFQKWLFGLYIVGNVGAKGVREIKYINRKHEQPPEELIR